MPARTTGSATATTTKTAVKRFELPALDFKFASLTDGTDIPPPLPSPIEEEPSELKKLSDKKTNGTEALSNGATTSSKTNGVQPRSDAISTPISSPTRSLVRAGLKRTADEIPVSPTLSSRPGSIRRLFSRNLLHTAYANAESEGSVVNGAGAAPGGIVRPESRSDGSIMDERRSRRSSGWFRRLRGGGAGDSLASSNGSIFNGGSPLSKRSSMRFEEVKKPAGPPPPMIPELGELKAHINPNDGGSLGNDLFKNIN